jgi:hypothetical protein
MPWVEQRAGLFGYGFGYRTAPSSPTAAHPTKPAAQIRAKEINVELAKEAFLDPREGKILCSSG